MPVEGDEPLKRRYVIIGVLFLLAAAVCLVWFVFPKAPQITPAPEAKRPIEDTVGSGYYSPIDFSALQKQNADICGWLKIPGTEISYPVVQNAEDDALYLNHNVDKNYDVNGALFTEHGYNSNDFSDPVTAIYGHHMKSGAMFGNLQQLYTDQFDDFHEVVVYRPQEELHYRVFAAIPYSNRHILYYYGGFRQEETLKEFLTDIHSVRAIGATVEKEVTVEQGDRLLVLSTCLQGDNTKRFLVIAKLTDVIN